jgi:hypothetical protein
LWSCKGSQSRDHEKENMLAHCDGGVIAGQSERVRERGSEVMSMNDSRLEVFRDLYVSLFLHGRRPQL